MKEDIFIGLPQTAPVQVISEVTFQNSMDKSYILQLRYSDFKLLTGLATAVLMAW